MPKRKLKVPAAPPVDAPAKAWSSQVMDQSQQQRPQGGPLTTFREFSCFSAPVMSGPAPASPALLDLV